MQLKSFPDEAFYPNQSLILKSQGVISVAIYFGGVPIKHYSFFPLNGLLSSRYRTIFGLKTTNKFKDVMKQLFIVVFAP
jgi:hypothetical protein